MAEPKTQGFTHFDADGNAVMVATGSIRVTDDILKAVQDKTMKKGDVLGVARVAGIMAVKQTPSIIPLCHPLPITKASIDFEVDADTNTITALCTVQCDGKTGVEMEALHGCTAALLTVYDMCKAVSKRMVLSDIHLVTKTGGKSGNFAFDEE